MTRNCSGYPPHGNSEAEDQPHFSDIVDQTIGRRDASDPPGWIFDSTNTKIQMYIPFKIIGAEYSLFTNFTPEQRVNIPRASQN